MTGSKDDTSRQYPSRPIVGVGVLVVKDNRLLLVKRAKQPSLGLWTVPGGVVELGEKTEDAAVREVEEECNIRVKIQQVLDIYNFVERDDGDRIKYHYVILDYLGEYVSGSLRPASDVSDARWFSHNELSEYEIPPKTLELVNKALFT